MVVSLFVVLLATVVIINNRKYNAFVGVLEVISVYNLLKYSSYLFSWVLEGTEKKLRTSLLICQQNLAAIYRTYPHPKLLRTIESWPDNIPEARISSIFFLVNSVTASDITIAVSLPLLSQFAVLSAVTSSLLQLFIELLLLSNLLTLFMFV